MSTKTNQRNTKRSRSGGEGQPTLSAERKKQKHNESERKRRQTLRMLFERLKELLDASGEFENCKNDNRTAILQKTIQLLEIQENRLKVFEKQFLPGLEQLQKFVPSSSSSSSAETSLTSSPSRDDVAAPTPPPPLCSPATLLDSPEEKYVVAPPPPLKVNAHVTSDDGDHSAFEEQILQHTREVITGTAVSASSSSSTMHDDNTTSTQSIDLDPFGAFLSSYDESTSPFSDAFSSSPSNETNHDFVNPFSDTFGADHPEMPPTKAAGLTLPIPKETKLFKAVETTSRFLLVVFLLFSINFSTFSSIFSLDNDGSTLLDADTFGSGGGNRVLNELSAPEPSGMLPLTLMNYLLQWISTSSLYFWLASFFLYISTLLLTDPKCEPGSFFWEQATNEEFVGTYQCTRTSQRNLHFLRALAFLGSKFPTTTTEYLIGIGWQSMKMLLQMIWIGFWIEKVIMHIRKTQPTKKKLTTLYLALMEVSTEREGILRQIYLWLCAHNNARLSRGRVLAETYAHLSFFIQGKFPFLSTLSHVYSQLAWNQAKSTGDGDVDGLKFLLFTTGHSHTKAGNFKEAELFLRQAIKATHSDGDIFGRKYALLELGIASMCQGALSKALFVARECSGGQHSTNASNTKLNGSDLYYTVASKLVQARILILMGRCSEAFDILQEFEDENLVQQAPNSLLIAHNALISEVWLIRRDYQRAAESASAALELALAAPCAPMFAWSISVPFVNTLLHCWEHTIKRTRQLSGKRQLNNADPAAFKRYQQQALSLRTHQEHLQLQCDKATSWLQSMCNSVPALKPMSYTCRASYYYNMKQSKKALAMYNLGKEVAIKLNFNKTQCALYYPVTDIASSSSSDDAYDPDDAFCVEEENPIEKDLPPLNSINTLEKQSAAISRQPPSDVDVDIGYGQHFIDDDDDDDYSLPVTVSPENE